MKATSKNERKKLIAMLTLIAIVMIGVTMTVLAEELIDNTTDETMADFFLEDEEIIACAVEEAVDETDFIMGEDGLASMLSE